MATGLQRPAWAPEPVEVVKYDPAWDEAGPAEGQRLQYLPAPWLAGNVEHVGSTAVPGLAAKATIDLQAPVADPASADAVASTLAPQGWHYVPPELDQRNYRRFYVKVVDDHHVAIAPHAPEQRPLAGADRLPRRT